MASMIKYLILMIMVLPLAFAIIPPDNFNFKNRYNITNVNLMNATTICFGTDCKVSWTAALTLSDISNNIGNWSADKINYATINYVLTVGNWSADKLSYSTTATITNLIAANGNWSADKINYPTTTVVNNNIAANGNWSADKSSYSTTSQINNIYTTNASALVYVNSSGYIKNWNASGLLINQTASLSLINDNSSWNESYARGIFTTNISSLAYINSSGLLINQTAGLTSDNTSWNKSYADSLYYSNTNPQNLINSSYFNSSTNITVGNITAKNITADYFFGQPLMGMLGSGLISSSQINKLSETNITCIGLTCSYNNFSVRLISGTSDSNAKYCDILSGSFTVTDNQQSVLYINSTCGIQTAEISNYFNNIITSGGVWDFANIVAYNGGTEVTNGIGLEQRRMMKERVLNFNKLHLSIVSGYARTTYAFPSFTIDTGSYIYLMDIVNTGLKNASNTDSIEVIYHNGSNGWITNDQTGMNYTKCDNGTSFITCTNTNQWRRIFFFMVGYNTSNGDNSQIHQTLPSNTIRYASEAACLDTTTTPISYTLPSWYQYSAVPLWAYCIRPQDNAWSSTGWIDLRSVKTGVASSGIDTSVFLLKDGTVSLTNNWNAGNFNNTADRWIANKDVTAPVVNVTNGGSITGNSSCTSISSPNNSSILYICN